MIKKRTAIGRLYTPMQNFLITGLTQGEPDLSKYIYGKVWFIGTEDDDPEIDWELKVDYYPRPGILDVQGSYVYKEFVNPYEINIFVKGEENETNGK